MLYLIISVTEAIVDTIQWRNTFGVDQIDPQGKISPLIESRFAYISPLTDKHGRAIVNIELNKHIHSDPAAFMEFLVYIVDRYVVVGTTSIM